MRLVSDSYLSTIHRNWTAITHSEIRFERMKLSVLFSAAVIVVVEGCARTELPRPADLPSISSLPFVHKIDIQQGNVVTQEMIAQLKPGMEKKKVNFIMGSPIILDAFHSNRWDYLYTMQEGGGRVARRRVTIYFEGDNLARIEGDIKPAAGKLVVDTRQDTTVEVPGVHHPGLIAKIKDTIPFVGEDKPHEDEDKTKKNQLPAVADVAPPDHLAPGPALTPIERAALEEQGGPGMLAKLKEAMPFSGDEAPPPESAEMELPARTADEEITGTPKATTPESAADNPGLIAKIKGALPFSSNNDRITDDAAETPHNQEESPEHIDAESISDEDSFSDVPPLAPTDIPLDNELDTDDPDSGVADSGHDEAEEVVVPETRAIKKRGFLARLFGRDKEQPSSVPDDRERRYRDLSDPDAN